MNENDLNYDDDEEHIKSRTQIKREMEELQKLGRRLTELKPSQLKEVPMGEDLAAAIRDFEKMKHREAKRRHMQFIGKLMRAEDSEAIQHAVDLFDTSSKRYTQELHQLESWRERLVAGGNEALSEFIETFPEVDTQQIRQLIRNAQKDLKLGKNTGASKKLFQFIKTLKFPS